MSDINEIQVGILGMEGTLLSLSQQMVQQRTAMKAMKDEMISVKGIIEQGFANKENTPPPPATDNFVVFSDVLMDLSSGLVAANSETCLRSVRCKKKDYRLVKAIRSVWFIARFSH